MWASASKENNAFTNNLESPQKLDSGHSMGKRPHRASTVQMETEEEEEAVQMKPDIGASHTHKMSPIKGGDSTHMVQLKAIHSSRPPAFMQARKQDTSINALDHQHFPNTISTPDIMRVPGNSADIIQRDTLSGTEALSEVRQDRVYEYIGHEVIYMDDHLSDSVQQQLANYGYRAEPLYQGGFDFQMRVFMPLNTEEHRNKKPVVAFRGSSSLADAFVDFDRSGVGSLQFRANIEQIRARIVRLVTRVIVVGHSLGGALAQLAAAILPDHIERIVTFQSPGISQRMVQNIIRYNQRTEGHNVLATHYRAYHDIVDDVGTAFAPGTSYEFNYDDAQIEGREGRSSSELMTAVGEHMSLPIRDLVRSENRSQLENVEVNREQVSGRAGDRVIESFRHDVLGLESPGEHVNLTIDEMLVAFTQNRDEIAARYNTWMRSHRSGINAIHYNHQFLLLEFGAMFFRGAEAVEVFRYVLDIVSDARAVHLFERLNRAINPNGFDAPPNVDRETWQQLIRYIDGRREQNTGSSAE